MSEIQSDAVGQPEGAAGTARPVVIVSGGNSTRPLVEPLGEHFDIGIMHPQIAQQAKEQGVTCFALDDGTTVDERNDGLNWAVLATQPFLRALARKRQNRIKDLLPRDKIFKPVSDGLEEWMPGYVISSVARMRARLKHWSYVWEERDVRLVVVHEDVSEDTRSLVQLAKFKGTPTLHIPHYNHGSSPADVGDVHHEWNCDWVAVAGQYMVDWYEARGADTSSVRITGHPGWDKYANAKADRGWGRGMLQMDRFRPVVTYASDWVLWTTILPQANTTEAGWRTMLAAFKPLQERGWQLVCRVHPNSRGLDDKWHAQVAKDEKMRCKVTSRPGHLSAVLQATDVLVCNGFSNLAAEAAMFGIPSISMGVGYQDEPAVPNVPHDPEILRKTIMAVAQNKDKWEELRPQFLERYVGPNDGQATERIIDWCLELAGIEEDNGEYTRQEL